MLSEEEIEIEKEKYRNNNSMDYLKAIELIDKSKGDQKVFETIYEITRLFIPPTVYKYYSFTNDKALNIKKMTTLEDNKIYLSSPQYLNDPFDNKAFYYDRRELVKIPAMQPHNGKLPLDIAKGNKLTCFTTNGINNMPIYSNNHNGYCVTYNTKNRLNLMLLSSLMPVQYVNDKIDITKHLVNLFNEIENMSPDENGKTIISNSIIYVTAFLNYVKHSSWQYENELRSSTVKLDEDFAHIDAYPESIYIGINCTKDLSENLYIIAKNNSIKLYLMKNEDNNREYELSCEQIL